MAKLLGIKEITTKAGNKGYNYYFSDDFSDYELEHNACSGQSVVQEYSSKAFDVKIGEECTLVYGRGFQDKAQLTNIVPFAPAKK